MPDAAAIIATLVAGALGGIGLWWSRRKLKDAGVGQDRVDVVKNLRELVDTWEQKYELEHEARMSADGKLAEVVAAQALERQLAAQDRRDLDDARSQIRVLERRRSPRGGPRPGG